MKYALSALAALAILVGLFLGLFLLNPSLRSNNTLVPIEAATSDNTPITTSTPECGLAWRGITSPNSGGYRNYLEGVDALSPNDLWAVGHYMLDETSDVQTLVQHWDGTQWSVISSPNITTHDSFFQAVDALSSNNVWAVGKSTNVVGRTRAFIQRWDGARWTGYNLPPRRDNYLFDVKAISPNDAWTVGYSATLSCCYPALAHWDGTAWTQVENLNLNSHALYSVDALSTNDVWVVGHRQYTGGADTFVMHWDGNQWSIIPSPNAQTGSSLLRKVVAISRNDVWAVGNSFTEDGPIQTFHSLIMHWDGTEWSIIPSPDIGRLYDVTGASSNDVWALSRTNGFLHWNGRDWSAVTGPLIANATLNSIVSVSANDVWAVGTMGASNNQTLAGRYNDPCADQLVGHVTWQGPPGQPHILQQLPITFTLKSEDTEVNYPSMNTSAEGVFTVDLGGAPSGAYQWRAKGSKYLASSGTVSLSLSRAIAINTDMGLMVVGDANNDNVIGVSDFNILKITFGRSAGDPGYDDRSEFTRDNTVNTSDFNLLRNNFNMIGVPPI